MRFKVETDRYIGPPIFDLVNIGRYTNFHRNFGVLVTAQFAPNSS